MKKSLGSRILLSAGLSAAVFLNSCVGSGVQTSVLPGSAVATGAGGRMQQSASAPSAYHMLYSFGGGLGGGNAATQLAFDAQGNAYGTTVQGGNAGCGTVFRLHPTGHGQWQETVLYNFSCFSDGKNPHGGVVRDAQGNLYGATTAGGLSGGCTGDGCGVIFELASGGTESVLYTFQGKNDGFGPGSPLVFDNGGNLYGTAPDGGRYAHGVVFSLTPDGASWHFTVIHAFSGGADGSTGSLGSLFVSAHGALYGVTELGGAHQAGIAYRMNHVGGSTWTFFPVYAFKGSPDGANPYGGLIESGGKLYGTTYFGGASGNGTVFELTPQPGSYGERLVYSFKGGSDGRLPTSTLLAAGNGTLYGTTSMGGGTSCDCGAVFSLAPATFAETVLHRFGAAHDGQNPYYGLSQFGTSLYSSTTVGGTSGNGTIFTVTP